MEGDGWVGEIKEKALALRIVHESGHEAGPNDTHICVTDDTTTGSSPSSGLETWSEVLDLRSVLREYGSNMWIINATQLHSNFKAWCCLPSARVASAIQLKPIPLPSSSSSLCSGG